MNPEQFAYWLQGFAELNLGMEQPTPEQWQSIVEHLATVFVKVTPPVQQTHQGIYDGKNPILRDVEPKWPGLLRDYQINQMQATC